MKIHLAAAALVLVSTLHGDPGAGAKPIESTVINETAAPYHTYKGNGK